MKKLFNSIFGREKAPNPKYDYEVVFTTPIINSVTYENKKYVSIDDMIILLKMCREKDPAFDKGYKAIQSIMIEFNKLKG